MYLACGKRNNLDDDGKDSDHHNFFEMLGIGPSMATSGRKPSCSPSASLRKKFQSSTYSDFSRSSDSSTIPKDTFLSNTKEVTSSASVLEEGIAKEEVASLKNLLESAVLPAAKKAEFRARLGELQERIRRAQNAAAGSDLQTTLKGAVEFADAAVAQSQRYCVLRIDIGLDTNAVREAVTLVMEKHKDLAVMIFGVDEEQNKVLVYAGVPNSAAKRGLVALDWLRASLAPIDGKGGGVKNGLAQGQGGNAAGIGEALKVAKAFATKIFAK